MLSEDADKYGIMLTPAVVFKGEVLISGKVPTFDSLKEMVEERM